MDALGGLMRFLPYILQNVRRHKLPHCSPSLHRHQLFLVLCSTPTSSFQDWAPESTVYNRVVVTP
jgi:hypothetical protein